MKGPTQNNNDKQEKDDTTHWNMHLQAVNTPRYASMRRRSRNRCLYSHLLRNLPKSTLFVTFKQYARKSALVDAYVVPRIRQRLDLLVTSRFCWTLVRRTTTRPALLMKRLIADGVVEANSAFRRSCKCCILYYHGAYLRDLRP